jgi:hypothetical protein
LSNGTSASHFAAAPLSIHIFAASSAGGHTICVGGIALP